MEKIKKIESLTNHLDKGLELTALIGLVISVIGAVLNVFFRYVLDMSFQIIEEICRYSIIYGAFAYVGPLIKRGEHLKMDILQNYLKGKKRDFNDLIISIVLFAAFVFLLCSSVIWTISIYTIGIRTVSGIMLMFIPILAIPLGMFFGCVYSLLQIIQEYYKLRYQNSNDLNINNAENMS